MSEYSANDTGFMIKDANDAGPGTSPTNDINNARFTIGDVHAWLGCSREANKRVWEDSGFLKAMSNKAINGYAQMLKTTSKNSLKHFLAANDFDHESTADFCVWEFQDNLKKKQLNHEKDCIVDFPNLPQFINYVKKSVTGMMATSVKKHLSYIAPDRVKDENAGTGKTPGTVDGPPAEDILFDADSHSDTGESNADAVGEMSDRNPMAQNGNDPEDGGYSSPRFGQRFGNVPFDEESIPDNNPNNNPGSNLEQAMMQKECMESARGLLAAFENWPELKGALKIFFHIVRELAQGFDSDNLADLVVIAMITARENHLFFRNKMKEYQGDAFNQNTWNANIRRLEIKWRSFLETEGGQSLYQDFIERCTS
jgi:hypothetical protein